MLTEVPNISERRRAWRSIQGEMSNGAARQVCTVGAQDGSSEHRLFLRHDLGIWLAQLKPMNSYLWCALGILPLSTRSNQSIVVQLSVTVTDGPQQTGGLLAVDESGEAWICHNGKMTRNKPGGLSKKFADWTNRASAPVRRLNGSMRQVFPIARVGDSNMVADIAEFVREVSEFKRGDSSPTIPRGKPPFGGSDEELESSTLVAARAGYRMERTHGLVHNKLADALRDAGLKPWRDSQRDICIGDQDHPDVEIEIKPSADSQSVYTAVGQLLMHSEVNPAKVKVLLIPSGLRRDRADAISRLGIHIATFRLTRTGVTFQDLPRSMSHVPTTVSLKRSKR